MWPWLMLITRINKLLKRKEDEEEEKRTHTENNDFMQAADKQQIISFLNFKHFYLFLKILFLAEDILFFLSLSQFEVLFQQVLLFFVLQLKLFIIIFMLFTAHG